jgi:site-specific recombinase XerD
LVLLLWANGLRISEVICADVDDLTTERGHRVMVTRKG